MGSIAGAVIGAGASLLGSSRQASAASDASAAQVQAANNATQAQMTMFNQLRNDSLPFQQGGLNAFNELNFLLGLPEVGEDNEFAGSQIAQTPTTPPVSPGGGGGGRSGLMRILDPLNFFNGDESRLTDPLGIHGGFREQMDPLGLFGSSGGTRVNPLQQVITNNPQGAGTLSGSQPQGNTEERRQEAIGRFRSTPGFQFQLEEGQNAVDRSAASRGGALSGRAIKDQTRFSQGLADQTFNGHLNRLAAQAGVGQVANNQLNNLGFNTAQGVANNHLNAGNARASGFVNQGNAFANGINGLGQSLGFLFGNRGGG